MLKMQSWEPTKNYQQAQGHFRFTMAECGGLADEEKPHFHSLRLLAKNKLRRMVKRRLRQKKFPQKNHNTHTNKKLLASCLDKQQFSCMICLEPLLEPTLLSCGHPFCRSCIENLNHISSQNRCSLCRGQDQFPFYEPDRTTSKIMEIICHMAMTPSEQKEYKTRQRRLRMQLEKRGTQCYIRVHDQIKVRVKDNWLKAIVTSIVKNKENIYYEVQTNTEEIFMVNCRSKNIMAQEQDLTRSREMRLFLENTQNASLPQPFKEVSNTYDIEDLLQLNTYPNNNNSWYFPSQAHSSLFFDLELHSLDGFISEVI